MNISWYKSAIWYVCLFIVTFLFVALCSVADVRAADCDFSVDYILPDTRAGGEAFSVDEISQLMLYSSVGGVAAENFVIDTDFSVVPKVFNQPNCYGKNFSYEMVTVDTLGLTSAPSQAVNLQFPNSKPLAPSIKGLEVINNKVSMVCRQCKVQLE